MAMAHAIYNRVWRLRTHAMAHGVGLLPRGCKVLTFLGGNGTMNGTWNGTWNGTHAHGKGKRTRPKQGAIDAQTTQAYKSGPFITLPPRLPPTLRHAHTLSRWTDLYSKLFDRLKLDEVLTVVE